MEIKNDFFDILKLLSEINLNVISSLETEEQKKRQLDIYFKVIKSAYLMRKTLSLQTIFEKDGLGYILQKASMPENNRILNQQIIVLVKKSGIPVGSIVFDELDISPDVFDIVDPTNYSASDNNMQKSFREADPFTHL